MLGDKLLFIEENEKHHDIWELIKFEDPESKTKKNDSYRDEQTAIENEEDEVMQFERQLNLLMDKKLVSNQ